MQTLWLVAVDEPTFQATVSRPVDLSNRDDKPVDFPDYARVLSDESAGADDGAAGAGGRRRAGAPSDGSDGGRDPRRSGDGGDRRDVERSRRRDGERGHRGNGERAHRDDGDEGQVEREAATLERGDPLLLYRNSRNQYVATGRAGPFWHTDYVPGEYWDGGRATDVFAIEGFTAVDVDPGTVNRVLDYEETFFPRAFRLVDDDRPVERLLRRVDLVVE